MPGSAPGASGGLLVRFDAATRESLRQAAAASERTVSQLVRAAVRWWVEDPGRVCPLHAVGDQAGGAFINVRFGGDLMVLVQSVAEQMGIERAGVIRCAVRAWLDVADVSALGSTVPHQAAVASPLSAVG